MNESSFQLPIPELSEQVSRVCQSLTKTKVCQRPPMRDQPAYRAAYTPDACTTQELLAVVIRGSDSLLGASALLDQFKNLQAISTASFQELIRVPGVGDARAASIKAVFELSRRVSLPVEEAPSIQSPDDAAAILMPKIGHKESERLMVLVLNTRNRLIGEPIEIYNGSLNTSLVRVGEVFRPALQANAAAIIIAHNHPSGDVTPSPEDVSITRVFVQAGKLLDVELLDHLIVARTNFVSLKARGLGFSPS